MIDRARVDNFEKHQVSVLKIVVYVVVVLVVVVGGGGGGGGYQFAVHFDRKEK